MYIKTFRRSITKGELYFNYAIMIQGILGALFAVIESILHFSDAAE